MEILVNGVKLNVANQAARKLIPGRSYVLSYIDEQLVVEFIREWEKDGDKQRTFKEEDGVTFEAYKYNGRFCVCSGACPCSVRLIMTDAEVQELKAENEKKEAQRLITRKQKAIENLKSDIARLESEILELQN